MTEAVEKDYLKKNLKIPIFSAPENAMRAFHLSYQWSSRKPRSLATQPVGPMDKDGADPILENGKKRGHLLLGEALELLKCYGFPMPTYGLARSETEALQLWRSLRGPVALKIHSPHIAHKSDRGAVRLNLDSEADVRKGLLDLQSIGGPGTEVLVQSMARKGRELILGGKQDPTFGPVVLFGLGGIFVEVLEDVVWHLAPFGFDEATQMIQKIRGAKMLRGVRGEAPYDIEATAELLVRLSQLLADYPTILEIDINPVMVFQNAGGAQALDARVIVRKEP
jgi:acyl-CoA synthetase (NDP forming)